MTDRERMMAIATATQETLKKVDDVLAGRTTETDEKIEDGRLVSIMDACKFLGRNYSWVYRRLQEGVLDIVDVSGRRLITKRSLIELLQGKRKPSEEVLKRRAERNAELRTKYAQNKATRSVSRKHPASVAAAQDSSAVRA